jgi:hypothetical protein
MTQSPALPAHSPLAHADQALAAAEREMREAAEIAGEIGQPQLEQALEETAEVLEDRQAALNIAAGNDEGDDEDSGKADAQRRAWEPLPPE